MEKCFVGLYPSALMDLVLLVLLPLFEKGAYVSLDHDTTLVLSFWVVVKQVLNVDTVTNF